MNNVLNCTGHELKLPNIVDSDGAFVFDERGERYLDLESGIWCTPLGHKNAGVNAAITRQINLLTHAGFCFSNDIVEDAAKAVLSITGFQDGKCVFLSSGSEAIELYSVHVRTRKSLGDMMRKLSDTSSHRSPQFLGTSSFKKPSIAVQNSLNVA